MLFRSDKYKVSRAKLAYIIDATAAPICIIAPISSWAAAVNSYVPEDSSLTGFQLFLRTIPYNLYALLTILMVFLIIAWKLDFGLMKKHEKNARNGDLFTSGREEFETMDSVNDRVNPNGRVMDLVLTVTVAASDAASETPYRTLDLLERIRTALHLFSADEGAQLLCTELRKVDAANLRDRKSVV